MCALWAVIPGHGMLRPRGGHMPVMHTPHVCPMSRHEPWPWHAKATWLVTAALLDTTTGLLDRTRGKVSMQPNVAESEGKLPRRYGLEVGHDDDPPPARGGCHAQGPGLIGDMHALYPPMHTPCVPHTPPCIPVMHRGPV